MGCGLAERAQLKLGRQGTWLPALALPPGSGDLSLLPAHLWANLPPTYERRWVQPSTPVRGPPPKPVSVEKGQGSGKSLEGGRGLSGL